jgi:hypothetical protein
LRLRAARQGNIADRPAGGQRAADDSTSRTGEEAPPLRPLSFEFVEVDQLPVGAVAEALEQLWTDDVAMPPG